MNYEKIYNSLIDKRKRELCTDRFVEIHHVVPRFCGGTNDKSNLVALSLREHFIAHLLLYKMYLHTPKRNAAAAALQFFVRTCKGYRSEFCERNSKMYGNIKREVYTVLAERMEGQLSAKCAVTGERVGRVKVNDPRIISGELIHTSSGRTYTDQQLANKPDRSNERNPNFKRLTPEIELIMFDALRGVVKSVGFSHRKKTIDAINEKLVPNAFNADISVAYFISKYGSWKSFVQSAEKHFGESYNTRKPKQPKDKPTCEHKLVLPKTKLEQLLYELYNEAWILKAAEWRAKTTPAESRSLNVDKLQQIFGVETGKMLYHKLTSSRGLSKSKFVERYGCEDGVRRYNEWKHAKQQQSTLVYKTQKYGQDAAEKLITERSVRNTANYHKFLKPTITKVTND